jgi:F-type H+-transporting ATPase subunit gamma
VAEGNDRVESRVDNISTVKPILEALRTISLGSWQSALKKQKSVSAFTENYLEILEMVAPFAQSTVKKQKIRRTKPESDAIQPVILMMVGSERGLCGAYNQQLLTSLKKEQIVTGEKPVALWILGTRLYRLVKRAGYTVDWWQPLSSTTLPEYSDLHKISRQWLKAYETRQLDEVYLLSHHYLSAGKSQVRMERLLPYSFDIEHRSKTHEAYEGWPTPILETNPLKLYLKVVEQMGTMRFYSLLLDAMAAEHSSRYQLMEEASQNAGRMIEEMTEILQMYRREAITREMQELASGAGLLGG